MENKVELQNEITKYQQEIAELEQCISALDENNQIEFVRIVECKRAIRDNNEFIERLTRRIDNISEPGQHTEAQLRRIEYVNSKSYDED